MDVRLLSSSSTNHLVRTMQDDAHPPVRVARRSGAVPAAERTLIGADGELGGGDGGLEGELDRAAVAAAGERRHFGTYRGRSSCPSVMTFRQYPHGKWTSSSFMPSGS